MRLDGSPGLCWAAQHPGCAHEGSDQQEARQLHDLRKAVAAARCVAGPGHNEGGVIVAREARVRVLSRATASKEETAYQRSRYDSRATDSHWTKVANPCEPDVERALSQGFECAA